MGIQMNSKNEQNRAAKLDAIFPSISNATRARAKRQNQLRFLFAFSKCGLISIAARAAQISPRTVCGWRRNSPGFSEAFRAAWLMANVEKLDMVAERVERELSERQISTDNWAVAVLQKLAPERYGFLTTKPDEELATKSAAELVSGSATELAAETPTESAAANVPRNGRD